MDLGKVAKYFIEFPVDKNWNTSISPQVMEGEPIASQKTSSLFKMKITDSNVKVPYLRKRYLIPCKGPARELTREQYIYLVHMLRPTLALPKDCEEYKISKKYD